MPVVFILNLCVLLCLFFSQVKACATDENTTQAEACATISPPPDVQSTGINVDLREPVYSNGVVTTEKGGVITGPDLRIQAMFITYTRRVEDGTPVHAIVAEGDLMLEFGDYIFVGDRLEYDFHTKTGVIYNGRTMAEPWFFGGSLIYLCEDGSYNFENCFVTTSENRNTDWELFAESASLSDGYMVRARNIRLKIFNIPVLWAPSFCANLNTIFDSPVRYNVKWGSRQGHRFGLIYELFSWNRLKAFLRLDYRLKRGLGGGIETRYLSEDHKTSFQSINYAARDSSIIHPGQRLRYRFLGIGDSLLMNDKVTVHLSYDKLSDIDMPTDYNDRGLDLGIAERTELLIRRQEDRWISNLVTHVRINNFQTIKQELPTFATSWRPFEFGSTGIIADNSFKASYLDFSYGNNQLNVHDYSSTRLELSPLFYRNFSAGMINITPEVGGVLLAYGNSPRHAAKWLTLGKFGLDINTQFWRHFSHCKHVVTPYIDYSYYTMPTVSPNDHYIFDIEDGWYRLNMMQFGLAQSIYCKQEDGYIMRRLYADLWANTFFDTHTFSAAIPKVYGNVMFNSFSFLRHNLETAWDFQNRVLDHYNISTEWTINADIAVAAEYRHRSPFDWRKADHTNFILDSFRSISELRHSQLSDRRDTLLFHIFYRFHPNWAFEFKSRHGWNRMYEPAYNEFEIDLLGTLPSAWNLKLSYQHREDDDRVSIYMTIGIKRPNCGCACIPSLEF